MTAELKRIGDDFKPRQFYLDKFGYKLEQGAIPYGAGPLPIGRSITQAAAVTVSLA